MESCDAVWLETHRSNGRRDDTRRDPLKPQALNQAAYKPPEWGAEYESCNGGDNDLGHRAAL